MVPRYHKYFVNITLIEQYCHSTRPFTMEERKGNIVQRHTQELLIQDIPPDTPITLRIQVICITINILYASGLRRTQQSFLPSLWRRVHSHTLVLLSKIKGSQRVHS